MRNRLATASLTRSISPYAEILQEGKQPVYPIGPEKSRGVIRLYWIGEDETPGVRYAREFTMATTRDVHAEDVAVIQAGQRGISSGALEHIHFQEKEILCRHLIKVVEEQVEAYKSEA